METAAGQFILVDDNNAPILEIKAHNGEVAERPFTQLNNGSKKIWQATPALPCQGTWDFRIRLSNGRYLSPENHDYFRTGLHTLWFQDNQIFGYEPAGEVAPSQVRRIDGFNGRLTSRSLYVYLPRGYDAHPKKKYPIIYMHDGQNVFETFVDDSYAGSWQADLVADRLIRQGQMPECIIVGVSHGDEERIQEYLPPYSRHPLPQKDRAGTRWVRGRAGQTAAYYIKDVAPYIKENYRLKNSREHTATCGSSMGGLFSLYLAWEKAEFAQNHAAMSPSIWTTKNKKSKFGILERLRHPNPPNIRLWIDSGTFASNGQGDDGQVETVVASEILLENGFVDGGNLQHYLDRGAEHNEAAWAGRLHKVFKYLLPMDQYHE